MKYSVIFSAAGIPNSPCYTRKDYVIHPYSMLIPIENAYADVRNDE